VLRPAGVLVVAGAVFGLSLPVAADGPTSDDTTRRALSSGRATFQQFCAPCHGSSGKGNGAVASYLLKAPPDVTQLRRRYNGVFPQADLEAVLLATTREQSPRALGSEELLWGPVFLSLGPTPESARIRVADLLAFLESVQEQ
jgi:hypothetical protein